MPMSAFGLNCTLTASPAASSTQLLLDQVLAALAEHGVSTDSTRVVDHHVKPGVRADEGDGDEWPGIRQRVLDAGILVVATPIWMGQPSSVASAMPKLIDRYCAVEAMDEAHRRLRAIGVDKALARTGAFEDARIEVTLNNVKPNRPTFKQLADTPGLSMESFGIGGATIEARVIAPDGTVTPVSYQWYENDIRWVTGYWTWTDAEWTFDRFARRLAHADQVASR